MDKSYDTLIAGASFAGLGALFTRPGGALLVERTTTVGPEFIETFRAGDGWHSTALTPPAVDLQRELTERGVLDGERVQLAQLGLVLCARLQQFAGRYLFGTEIAEVQRRRSGFAVTLVNASGWQTIRVRRILDTTPTAATRLDGKPAITSTWLGAFLKRHAAGPAPLTRCTDPDFEIMPGRFDTDLYFSLKMRSAAAWPEARQRFHNFWTGQRAQLAAASAAFGPTEPAWNVAAIAAVLDLRPAAATDNAKDWDFLPSASYANGLAAFDAGCRWATGKEVRP